MIRLHPYANAPWIADGRRITRNTTTDSWWMRWAILNSCMIPYDGDTVLCSVRGNQNDIDEVGFPFDARNNGPTILQAPLSSDLGNLDNWTILHPSAPAFTPDDIPYEPLSDWWISQLSIFTDPDVVTGGHTRVYASFKLKGADDGAAPKGFCKSDDGGVTWSWVGYFMDENDVLEEFGQSIVWKARGAWHMITSRLTETDKATFGETYPAYYTSTGPDLDNNWRWSGGNPIGGTEGGNGSWNDTNRIGVSAFEEDGYCYATLTSGAGKERDFGTPLAIPDWLDTANLSQHSDYPSSVGLWRCAVADMGTPGAWEEYPRNPIAIRSSIGETGSGGMWNGSSVVLPDGSRRYTFEHVGVRDVDGVLDQQRENIRDGQYGKAFSYLRIPTNAAYSDSSGLTVHIQFIALDLGGSLIASGPHLGQARDPDVPPGSFYASILLDGSIELKWMYEAPVGGGQIMRRIVTAPGAVTAGNVHDAVFMMGPNGAKIFLDGNTALITSDGAVNPMPTDQNMTLGARGGVDASFHGFFRRVALMVGEQNYNTITAASAGDLVGLWYCSSLASGSPWTTPDASPTGNDIDLLGPCYDGGVKNAARANSIYLMGLGLFYSVGAGSQQHQWVLASGSYADEWDDDPWPDGVTVTIRHARTGKYLAVNAGEVVMRDSDYWWAVSWQGGFMVLTDWDGNLLTVSSRTGGAGLEVSAATGNLQSPYSGYDLQHWHPITHEGGSVSLQNRGCGRALTSDGSPVMESLRNSYGQRWRLDVVR